LKEIGFLGEKISIFCEIIPLGESMRECYYELTHALADISPLIPVDSSESGI